MKKIFFHFLMPAVVTVLLFISCQKELTCENCGGSNKSPIANAGPDQTIILPIDSVKLDGSLSSDADGTISSFQWTKISGPASFAIITASVAGTSVKQLVMGVYQFELKVTDNGGLSAKDTVQITVNDPAQPNRPPVAKAGANQTITLPTNTINLDGSGSTDPDNNITNYAWTKISGPFSFNITTANAVQTPVTNLVQGIYKFELKVTDAGGLFSKDTVMITVNPNPVNTSHWTSLGLLDANEFFFGPRFWFNGSNFFMGVNNKLFVVSNKGGLWQYDPQTNGWDRKGNFPEQMAEVPVVFSVNNKGYCIGSGHCWQYDATTNQWVRKNDAPNYIAGGAVPLVINNKVYLVSSTNNHVMAYDPVTDSYTQKNNFPVAGAATGFVINGEGYCIGGNGQCWKYDVATDNWQQKASLPSSVFWSLAGFTLSNSGYIIGDLNGNAYNLNYPMKVWRYDPLLNQWNQDEDYPGYGVNEINTVSFNGIVYVGIGYNSGDFNETDFWKYQ